MNSCRWLRRERERERERDVFEREMILPEALPILFTTNKLTRCTCVLAHAVPVIITQQQWHTEGG